MSTNASPMDRLKILDGIEKEIIFCLQHAGQALAEMGKEKTSWKQADAHIQSFTKTLGNVENNLTTQINYLTQVSTGQPHEGSGYASQKVLQMAWHRIEHARSRVSELERIKNRHLHDRAAIIRQQQLQQQHLQQQQLQQQQQVQQNSQQIKTETFK